MGSSSAAAALVVIGILLVVLGLLAPVFPLIVLGVVSLVAAGILQVMGQRRT